MLVGILATLTLLSPRPTQGQVLPMGGSFEEYLRVLQVRGLTRTTSFMVRPLPTWESLTTGPTADHPWAEALEAAPEEGGSGPRLALDPAQLSLSANSATPFGRNDGAHWQGKGLNAALEGGATGSWGPFRLTLHPTLVWAQNLDFPLAPVEREGAGELAYPWWIMDLPQRMGTDAWTRLDPGQSSLSASWRGGLAGFGTENLWWGPGTQNAILVSNHAAGFPHAFLGTGRPLALGGAGTLEGRWIWGRLQESDWYREGDAGQARFITGAVVVYSPAFLEGLSLGVGRVFTRDVPPEGLDPGDYLAVLQPGSKKALVTEENPTGDDDRDQMASVLARWVLPESGFEVYGEWARNDHFWDLGDLETEPEHSQSYTLGFQKVESLSGRRLLALGGELTHLERSKTLLVRATPVYYTHHFVVRGYTQRGQIIGAGVGPGGNGQHMSMDLYTPAGRWGLFAGRQVHDNDAYYEYAAEHDLDFCCHDVSLTLGARGLRFTGAFDVAFELALTSHVNRYFQQDDDLWNVHGNLSLGWRPR